MIKRTFGLIFACLVCSLGYSQTDWIRTGTGLGVEKVRIAVADFKNQSPNDSATNALLGTFNDVLFNDLTQAGIFEVVSKNFNPLQSPGSPAEMKLEAWNVPPPNA